MSAAPPYLLPPPQTAAPPTVFYGGVLAWGHRHTPIILFIPTIIILSILLAFFALYFLRDSLRCRLSSFLSGRHRSDPAIPPSTREKAGLDPAIQASFPIFHYSDARKGKLGRECAVCLSEFAGGDLARLLAVCCHAFHPACIDPWLAARATCPVCRSDLRAPPDEAALLAVWEALGEGGRDSHVITFEEGHVAQIPTDSQKDSISNGRSRDEDEEMEEEEEEEEEEERCTICQARSAEEHIVR